MQLQKTDRSTGGLQYMISGTPANLRIDVWEREVGVGSDIYRVVGEDNQLLQAIEESKDDIEWEER